MRKLSETSKMFIGVIFTIVVMFGICQYQIRKLTHFKSFQIYQHQMEVEELSKYGIKVNNDAFLIENKYILKLLIDNKIDISNVRIKNIIDSHYISATDLFFFKLKSLNIEDQQKFMEYYKNMNVEVGFENGKIIIKPEVIYPQPMEFYNYEYDLER